MSEQEVLFGPYCDGKYIDTISESVISVADPYSGEQWETVRAATREDIDTAVAIARRAFQDPEWRETAPDQRAAILEEIATVIEDHAEELAELQTRENGRIISTRIGNIEAAARTFRYYAAVARTLTGEVNYVGNKQNALFSYTDKDPYGVVATITPWNAPLLLLSVKLAPALAAGNTVVHKPSEVTPVSALRFCELVHEHTALPDGVYNVLPGFGKEAGQALVEHEDVDKITFTGSTEVGKQIASTAGDNVVPVTLELGGKSPNIVFPSADLSDVLNGMISGIFVGAGQSCFVGSRGLVHESIFEDVLEELSDRIETLTLGDPTDPATDIPPISTDWQHKKIQSYIKEASQEGATIVQGGTIDTSGERSDHNFIKPTIVTDVDNEMRIAQEEIFGPVLCLISFSSEEEAISLANQTKYGLAAGIWTGDISQAFRVADRVEAGTVWVNEYRHLNSKVPAGGYKQSGMGREHGLEGLLEFMQTKSVWIDTAGEVPDPFE